jgi:hypothetical protein
MCFAVLIPSYQNRGTLGNNIVYGNKKARHFQAG